jgi:hypothetical protein
MLPFCRILCLLPSSSSQSHSTTCGEAITEPHSSRRPATARSKSSTFEASHDVATARDRGELALIDAYRGLQSAVWISVLHLQSSVCFSIVQSKLSPDPSIQSHHGCPCRPLGLRGSRHCGNRLRRTRAHQAEESVSCVVDERTHEA